MKSRIKVTGQLISGPIVTLGIVDTLDEAEALVNEYYSVFGIGGQDGILIDIEIGKFKKKPAPRVAYALAVLMFGLNFSNIMGGNKQVESYYSWLKRTNYKQYN